MMGCMIETFKSEPVGIHKRWQSKAALESSVLNEHLALSTMNWRTCK